MPLQMLIFMPRFKSINFYQNNSKSKLFLPKNIPNFRAPGAPPPGPRAYVPPVIEGYAPSSQMPPPTAGPYTPSRLQISCHALIKNMPNKFARRLEL